MFGKEEVPNISCRYIMKHLGIHSWYISIWHRPIVVGKSGPSPITSLSPITLANLCQFFSILSDLKCYSSPFSRSTNHLGKCKAKGAAKKESIENTFFRITKHVFFSFFFILTPPISSVHNFLIFGSNWAI